MPTPREILSPLTRDELDAIAQQLDLVIGGRRSKDQLVDAISHARAANLTDILSAFSRDRLKQLCRALGLDDSGRDKASIVARIVGEPSAQASLFDAPAKAPAPVEPEAKANGKPRGRVAAKKDEGASSGGANLGFERTLFQAADKLRNNMDAAEYKHVVLGLVFLEYISDAFDERHRELVAQVDEPCKRVLRAVLLAAALAGFGCGVPDRSNDTPRDESEDAGAADGGAPETSFEIDCMPDAGAASPPCPAPVRMAAGVNTTFPHLVWTGSNYGLAFTANFPSSHEARFARLDASGSVIGASVVVAGGPDVGATPVRLAWSGSQYGIAWVDARDGNPEIYFARLDANGTILGSDVRVTNAAGTSILPALVAHASGFAIVWHDDRTAVGDNEVYFTRLDENGIELGDDTLVTSIDGAISQEPSIAWTGSEYGIAWYDRRDGGDLEIYFTRMDSAGVEIGDDLRLTDSVGISTSPHLIAVPGGYALCWDDKRDGNMEIYCGKLDAKGAWLDAPRRITQTPGSSLFPSLTPTGAGFAVAWDDPTCGMYDVYFSALDSSAAKLGPTLAITNQGAAHPSLVWDGSGLAAAWHDFRYGAEEVVFCRLFR